MSYIETVIDKTKEAVKRFRECGVTDELVLLVPYISYIGYSESTWESARKEAGVDHVECCGIGFPQNVEAMVMQRSEYLRMFIKELQRSVMENDNKRTIQDNR